MPHVYCSAQYPMFTEKLKSLGITVIETIPNPLLPKPVCHHADMLSCFIDPHTAILHRSQAKAADIMRSIGMDICMSDTILKDHYPYDIPLNCLIIKNVAYCRSDYLDSTITSFVDSAGKKLTVKNVHQGYACCSVLKISETAAITADKGLAHAMEQNGVDVLRIESGNIRLDGYDYGFIGGCSGYISSDTIAFAGNLFSHPNGKDIADFIEKHRRRFICLSDCELIDIGGIRLCG